MASSPKTITTPPATEVGDVLCPELEDYLIGFELSRGDKGGYYVGRIVKAYSRKSEPFVDQLKVKMFGGKGGYKGFDGECLSLSRESFTNDPAKGQHVRGILAGRHDPIDIDTLLILARSNKVPETVKRVPDIHEEWLCNTTQPDNLTENLPEEIIVNLPTPEETTTPEPVDEFDGFEEQPPEQEQPEQEPPTEETAEEPATESDDTFQEDPPQLVIADVFDQNAIPKLTDCAVSLPEGMLETLASTIEHDPFLLSESGLPGEPLWIVECPDGGIIGLTGYGAPVVKDPVVATSIKITSYKANVAGGEFLENNIPTDELIESISTLITDNTAPEETPEPEEIQEAPAAEEPGEDSPPDDFDAPAEPAAEVPEPPADPKPQTKRQPTPAAAKPKPQTKVPKAVKKTIKKAAAAPLPKPTKKPAAPAKALLPAAKKTAVKKLPPVMLAKVKTVKRSITKPVAKPGARKVLAKKLAAVRKPFKTLPPI